MRCRCITTGWGLARKVNAMPVYDDYTETTTVVPFLDRKCLPEHVAAARRTRLDCQSHYLWRISFTAATC